MAAIMGRFEGYDGFIRYADKGFTHLHLHSQYSLLDGAISFERLLARCKALGMNAVAVTDHGNMFGAVEFYTKARAAQIKPIIGIEAYVAPGSRFDRTKTRSPTRPTT
jgi:DNA polymerase-3 subunit alpha